MTNMTNINAHKHKPWGLTVPGRPPTPSEGAAYQYSRIGPTDSQRLFSFENGTCLEYGPDDPVDEFEIWHPFANQVAIIDKAIRDIKAVRDRYQRPGGILMERSESGSESEEDPFDNFRSQQLDPSLVSSYSIDSGTYKQVPSRFATVGNLISVYSYPNKSDLPAKDHPGFNNDTRFGTTGKPPFPTTPRRLQNRNSQNFNGHRSQNATGQQRSLTQNAHNGGQAPADRNRGRRRANRSISQALTDSQSNSVHASEQEMDGFGQGSQNATIGSDRQEQDTFDQESQYSSMGPAGQSSVENMHYYSQMHAGQPSSQQFQQVDPADHLIRQQFPQAFVPQQMAGFISIGNDGQAQAHAYHQNIQQYNLQQYLQQLSLQQQSDEEQLIRQLNDARQDAMNMATGGNVDYAQFLDDQNRESRARGEQVLRGDDINGQTAMQFRETSSGEDYHNVMVPNGGRRVETSSRAASRTGILRTPFPSFQSEQGNTSSPPLSYDSGSRTPTSRAPADNSSDQLLAGLRRSRSDTAFLNPNEGHLQDQAYPRQHSVMHSPEIYNPTGRTFQSTMNDSHRIGRRITQPLVLGGRPGSATNSTTSSDEHRPQSAIPSEHTIFGEVPGSMSRRDSPSGGFRHIRNFGGRRLWDSRASSPGLLDMDESREPETEVGRSRHGNKGHSRHDSRRSVSAGSMR